LTLLTSGDIPGELVALRGNHEAMILQFLETPDSLEMWRKNGGLETLHSYGVPVSEVMRGSGFERAREALKMAMPLAHLRFLNDTLPSATFGDYFFCHAGVRPGLPLEAQSHEDLLWIREEFLTYPGDFGKLVVHGHTPVTDAELRPNRINVDTGAFMTGHLSCLVLDGDQKQILQT
jgi:serine/threonine protein phosphatase 1